MPNARMDPCVIHVSEWERSNRFHRAAMGADVVSVQDRWSYRFEEQQLNLHDPGVDTTPDARVPAQPGNSDPCFEWLVSIGEALEHLARHGVEVELGPVERFGVRSAGTSVYFRDPDGPLQEFISYSDGQP